MSGSYSHGADLLVRGTSTKYVVERDNFILGKEFKRPGSKPPHMLSAPPSLHYCPAAPGFGGGEYSSVHVTGQNSLPPEVLKGADQK